MGYAFDISKFGAKVNSYYSKQEDKSISPGVAEEQTSAAVERKTVNDEDLLTYNYKNDVGLYIAPKADADTTGQIEAINTSLLSDAQSLTTENLAAAFFSGPPEGSLDETTFNGLHRMDIIMSGFAA